MLRVEFARSLLRIRGLVDQLATPPQDFDEEVADAGLVVNDQNGRLRKPWTEFRIDDRLDSFSRCILRHSTLSNAGPMKGPKRSQLIYQCRRRSRKRAPDPLRQ